MYTGEKIGDTLPREKSQSLKEQHTRFESTFTFGAVVVSNNNSRSSFGRLGVCKKQQKKNKYFFFFDNRKIRMENLQRYSLVNVLWHVVKNAFEILTRLTSLARPRF